MDGLIEERRRRIPLNRFALSDMDHFIAQWRQEEAAPFSGWDFSRLAGRKLDDAPPWDYAAQARVLVAGSTALLDVATGGGEVLASLAPFNGAVHASEGYLPNVAVAQARLQSLGGQVVHAGDAGPWPFKDGAFDLLLNRHGGCWSAEQARVLVQGGLLLTQQVAGDDSEDLLAHFGVRNQWPDNTLAKVARHLEGLGFEILEQQAWTGWTRFTDVGAIVYTLKATPWLVPGFSVDGQPDALLGLQAQLERQGALAFKRSAFLIRARKR
jgi:SAM-dependent methyltransferase